MDDGANSPPSDRPKRSEQLDDGTRIYKRRSTGAYVSPAENTWAAHAQVIKKAHSALGFDAQNYDYFDGAFAEKLGLSALTNPKHADYARYEALRNNVAVLRNFILSYYEESGQFKNGSYEQRDRIESIAESLGQALANDKWGSRAFTKFASIDVANIDGVGAMEMYKHLLDLQENPTMRQPMIAQLKSFLALPNRDWGLPPLAASPFHPQALAAPPPGYAPPPPKPASTNGSADTNDSDSQSRDLQTKVQEQPRAVEQMAFTSPENIAHFKDEIEESIAIVEHIVQVVNSLQHIDTLAEIPREESVEEARKILRFLRNMEFTEHPLEEFLDQGTPSTIVGKKQSLARLTDIFAAHLRHAQSVNPSIASTNAAVEQARDTLCTIALELAEHTRRMLRDEDEREERLNQLIDSLPHEADLRINQPVGHLLETVELGLEHASGRELATTTLERLLLSSERLEQHNILLQHLKEGEEPSREESIELARKALQRIEQLPMGERSLLDFIDHGSPKEQAAFAQQVEELVGIYRNIVVEAAQSNGEVILDPKVKEANDAIGGFAHAVKLMAAKEMPNSIASAQQISAEAANEPTQWKDLSHHAVNRLVKSAEGGLEKAIGEIASDEEEQEEDLASEIIAETMTHLDNTKRKKKRRGDSKSRSGKGAKKQKKKMLDITADDYALKQGRFAEDSKEMRKETPGNSSIAKETKKQNNNVTVIDNNERMTGQGRFSEQDPVPTMRNTNMQTTNTTPNRNPTRTNSQTRPSKPATPLQGLKEADLAAIAKLGGSLRDIGNQLQGLNVANVSGVDKVAPDNRNPKPQERDQNLPRNQGPSK